MRNIFLFIIFIFFSCGKKVDTVILFSGASNIEEDNSYCKDKKNNTPYASGSGTIGDPYTICSANQFNQIATRLDYAANLYFKVMGNIDFSGVSFNMAGVNGDPFYGVFDGNNYELKNISLTGDSVIGVFGIIGSGAFVINVRAINVNIQANIYAGGLVGFNLGTIDNCVVDGSVTGISVIGGLVGTNRSIITNSYASVIVTGGSSTSTGGLVGENITLGNISTSESSSIVTGYDCVGGIAGKNEAIMTDVFFTGLIPPTGGTINVGLITGCT